MALIDLPPEPSLYQSATLSSSAIIVRASSNTEVQHLYTSGSRPSGSMAHWPEHSGFPISLIPPEQLAKPGFKDFSKPSFADFSQGAIAQLPPLPEQTTPAPAPPILDEETRDTIGDALDTDTLDEQTINPADIEAVDPPLNTDSFDADSIDLDSLDPDTIDLDTVNDAINSDDLGPNELENIDEAINPDAPEPRDFELAPTPDDPADVTDPNVLENDAEVPASPSNPPAAPSAPLDPSRLEITADTQVFDSDRQVVIARGNVVFKLNNAFLLADELWVNLNNRYALAEGNVILTRGEQEVRGERAEYNLLQEAGTLFETRGELFLPALEDDFASPFDNAVTSRTVFDPLNPDQEINSVTAAGGFQISSRVSASLPDAEGNIRRLRFEAARIEFDAESWVAEDVRLTNDPFSPPELEFRTERMTLTTLSPTADLLTTEDPRLVFDQGLSLPLFRSRYVLNRGAPDSNQINPFIVEVNSDSSDRGGVFLESEIPVVRNETSSLTVTPQYFIERALNQGFTDSEVFGIKADFDTRLSPRSDLSAGLTLTGIDLDQLEDNLRGNIRNRYLIGNHLLAAEYSYRDRLFNGSLGFQDVRSSLGAVLLSPPINLDGRGLILTYQTGAQLVTSKTDRVDLLDGPLGGDDLVTLGRFQGSVRLGKGFNLWQGKPLPATQTEGLRYTPSPLVPFLNLNVGLLGVGSYYTSGDFQGVLAGDIRFDGQVGHLSDNFFDYTRFNLGYYRAFISGDSSPFLFDRDVDNSVLSFGIVQQIFGPILLGFQTSINLDNNDSIDTEIIGEYSRRTYGLVIRYSPTRATGSIGFRLSDFNWLGSGSPFDEPDIRQVDGGVLEQR